MDIKAVPTAKHLLPDTKFSMDASSGTCISNVWEVQKETFPKITAIRWYYQRAQHQSMEVWGVWR